MCDKMMLQNKEDKMDCSIYGVGKIGSFSRE